MCMWMYILVVLWMAIYCDLVFSRYDNGWRRRREGVPLGNWLWEDLVSLCNVWLLVLVGTLFKIVAFKMLEDFQDFNTLRTGDANLRFLRFCITTVKDKWRKSAFLTRAWFPCTSLHNTWSVFSEWSSRPDV
jgi:hypothetical protein